MASAIGIDIGGTHVRAARIASDGKILDRLSERTNRDAEALLRRLTGLVAELGDASTEAVGIGVPGRVDSEKGLVLSGGYVDLSVVPLRAEIAQRSGRFVFIDNDCSMALAGEAALGAARGMRSAAMLTLGTGIGGALMQDGAMIRGRACAGQLGHIVVDPAGSPCNCGRRGCLETTSSGTSLGRIVAAHGLPPGATIEWLLQRAEAQDPAALRVIESWGTPLRMAIDTIASAFDPQIVVLGGGLGQAGVQVLDRLAAAPSWGETCPVAAAQLGDDAGIIGAALSALRHRAMARDVAGAGP